MARYAGADGTARPGAPVVRAVRAARSVAVSHPVAMPFLVAFVIRALAATSITLVRGYLFPDEPQYVALGRLAASGRLTPNYQVYGQTGESLFHEAAAFMWPLTVLFRLFGAHVLLASLWAALFGALTAALVALLVGQLLSSSWAAAAGMAVAVFPSQVVWSSVVLRESMVWAGLGGVAVGIALLARARRWPDLTGAGSLMLVSLLDLAYLRDWVFISAAWATAVSVWVFRPARPAVVRAVCLALCLVVPVVQGLGPAGISYVHKNSNVSYKRSVLSLGAKSAFVHPKVVLAPPVTTTKSRGVTGTTPRPHPGVGTGKAATGGHAGSASRRRHTVPSQTSSPTTLVPVPGNIGLPDEDLVLQHSGLANDLSALPGGLVAFLLRPFPGQHGDGLSYDLAALEELLYYPLYLLAAVGLVVYRNRRDVLAFPLLVTVLISGIAAEAEGNLGSAFRHRDQLLWVVVLFATLGARFILSRWRDHAQLTGVTSPTGHNEAPKVLEDA